VIPRETQLLLFYSYQSACVQCKDVASCYSCSMICLLVLLSSMIEPYKTAVLINMRFGLCIWVGPRNHVLGEGLDSPGEGAVFGLSPIKMYYTHTRLTALCSGLPGWAGTRKVKPIWILLKQETVSGISWAICKSALHSRQITMPAPHHSVFCRPDALTAAQPTASKH